MNVWETLVHEFPISYSHSDWYFIFSLFGAREAKHAQQCLAMPIIGIVPASGCSNHLILKNALFRKYTFHSRAIPSEK